MSQDHQNADDHEEYRQRIRELMDEDREILDALD